MKNWFEKAMLAAAAAAPLAGEPVHAEEKLRHAIEVVDHRTLARSCYEDWYAGVFNELQKVLPVKKDRDALNAASARVLSQEAVTIQQIGELEFMSQERYTRFVISELKQSITLNDQTADKLFQLLQGLQQRAQIALKSTEGKPRMKYVGRPIA